MKITAVAFILMITIFSFAAILENDGTREPIAQKLAQYFSSYLPKKEAVFVNSIEKSQVVQNGRSSGIAWVDLDNDGHQDLAIFGSIYQAKLYHNNGDNTFQDITRESGLELRLQQEEAFPFAGIFADYDNDGCQDLYVSLTTGRGKTGPSDHLFHNDCNGHFTDVSAQAGIKDTYHGRSAAWADYNNDGYLDLYVANHGDNQGNDDNMVYLSEPNILYHNNGNGTFTNVTTSAGVIGAAQCDIEKGPEHRYYKKVDGPFKQAFQPVWFDYNNDNNIDLFITNDGGINTLYSNNGNGTFTDTTKEAKICRYGQGMGVDTGDFDNDGDFDIYTTNVGANYFWRNNGDGTFTDVAAEYQVSDLDSLGWGTMFLDYDNDGDLDLYVVNGNVLAETTNPKMAKEKFDKLFRNDGAIFSDITSKTGIYGNEPKEAGALADYNNDGFTDIMVLTGSREQNAFFRLYENQGNRNHWLTIKLVGKKSNRDAIGTKITLKTQSISQTRQITGGSSFISQNSLWQTFGLASAKKADLIKITWPSGKIQILENIKADQKITITEEN